MQWVEQRNKPGLIKIVRVLALVGILVGSLISGGGLNWIILLVILVIVYAVLRDLRMLWYTKKYVTHPVLTETDLRDDSGTDGTTNRPARAMIE
jgi:hypothetical protein